MSVCELSEEEGEGGGEEGEERRIPEVTLRPRCVCVCVSIQGYTNSLMHIVR